MAATQTSTQVASETHPAGKRSDEFRANPIRRPATDDEILGIGQATGDAAANSNAG
jgi:hypothetical protein